MRFIFALILMLVGFLQTAWSTDLIAKDNDIFYYKFQTLIPLPDQFTKIVKPLYFNTYDPVLHEGYSLEEMKIDPEIYPKVVYATSGSVSF